MPDERPELVDLDLGQVHDVDQHLGERLGVRRRLPQPLTDRFVLVPRHLLGGEQTPAAQHDQQRLRHFRDRRLETIHRRAGGRAERAPAGPVHSPLPSLRPALVHRGRPATVRTGGFIGSAVPALSAPPPITLDLLHQPWESLPREQGERADVPLGPEHQPAEVHPIGQHATD